MADTLLVPTYEQIATLLAKLAYNYSSLASVFEKVFYDKIPDDVEISIYNEAGELVTYTIDNIAKVLQNILSGDVTPEGNVEGTKGSLYQDLTNGDLYIKETPSGKEGWNQITTNTYLRNIFIQGNGDPNGNVVAERGILYIDTSSAVLYIKTAVSGNEGWEQISASIAAYADVDLSNLSDDGEAHFANPDLSNLSPLGEQKFEDRANVSLSNLNEAGENHFNSKFDLKENLANKVTTISASSTNTQYPSAKAVYDSMIKATYDSSTQTLYLQ
jgi:hypothetical protein